MKNRIINKIGAFFVFMSIFLGVSKGQTPFFTENYETGATGWTLASGTDFGNNVWVINNIYEDNFGILTPTPSPLSCFTGGQSSSYLHIFNAPLAGLADLAAYDANTASEAVATSSPISTLGRTNVGFRFFSLCQGLAGSDFGQVSYSINGGASFVPLPTLFHSNGNWTSYGFGATDVSNALDNQASVIFQFKWTNDGSNAGADPAWSIDEFEMFDNFPNFIANPCTTTVTGGTNYVGRTSYCLPDTMSIGFITPLATNAGNNAEIELSDISGNFPGTILQTAPTGALVAGQQVHLSSITIPGTTIPSTNYKVRINTTNPVQNLTEYPTAITIANCGALSMTQPATDFQTSYCLPESPSPFPVNYTASGYTDGNQFFIIEMSDASGSFASATTIGTKQGISGGIINCDIPNGTPAGTGYRFRIRSTNPPAIGPDNGFNVTVNSTVAPSFTLSPTSVSICTGQSQTFTTSNLLNGGTNPTYTWAINGTTVSGQTASTFTTTTLANGDNVTVTVTSNAACANPATATQSVSNITVTVGTAPSVSITPTSVATCVGQSITFTANPSNATSPTYQWLVNGSAVAGQTNPTFTSSTLPNGAVISCTITSSGACSTGPVNSTNTVPVTISPSVTPSVQISANPSGFVCTGTPVSFSIANLADSTNLGGSPVYSWTVNGAVVGTGATFTSNTLTNGQTVVLTVTSNANCVTTANVVSNTITANVGSASAVGIGATTSVGGGCVGSPITFTAGAASNGGSAPTYQWLVNGIAVSGANSSTFTSATLNNGDNVSVTMTSNSACITGSASVTSTPVPVTVSNPIPLFVNLTNPGPQCAGSPVKLTASPLNNGTNIPTFTWFLNGVQQGPSTTDSTFTYTPTSGDQVTVQMNLVSGCFTNNPATSAVVTIPVNPAPSVSCSVSAAGNTISPTNVNVTLGGGTVPYKIVVDFGDGSKDSVQNVLGTNFNIGHQYTTAASYNVSVVLVDANGCTATSTCGSVVITTATSGTIPVSDFTIVGTATGCGSVTVSMNNTSTNATSYAWSTTDGQTSTQINPTFTFTTGSNVSFYGITLVATNATGNDTKTLTNSIIVYPNLVTTINGNREYCLLSQVCLVDSTVGANSWLWDMGNGSTSTAQNWCAFYTPGVYPVKLTTIGAGGCTDDTTITITVIDTPRVNFNRIVPNASCAQAEVTFTNTTTGASGYLWDFGDGTFSNDSLPTHVYTSSGFYTVTLYAESLSGCTTMSFTDFLITILPVPTAIFTVDSSLIKLNPTAINTFNNTSIGADTLKWDFGNGQTLTQTFPFTNPSATYTTPGVYTVRLYAINQLGCIDSTTRTFTVDVNESVFIPNVFSPNGDLMNDTFGPNLQGFTNYSTMIYDRWGNLVVTIKENALWDGTRNGAQCPEGVYVYTFKGTLNSGKEVEKVGSISLIR